MLGLSIWKIIIIAGIVVVLFGRGKISETMTDVAKGIKSFKRGMAEEETEAKTIDAKAEPAAVRTEES